MPRLVMKFGGTSVATVERIKNVARHVKREVEAGYDVAVVVSAMAGKTNELVAWCKEAAPLYDAGSSTTSDDTRFTPRTASATSTDCTYAACDFVLPDSSTTPLFTDSTLIPLSFRTL